MAVDNKQLQFKMLEKGIRTNRELAKLSGVNENTIASVVDNKSRPSTNTIDKISKALDLTREEIGTIFFK